MGLTAWKVEHDDVMWGAGAGEVFPEALAKAVVEHEGESRYTYYGKPYVLKASDAQSVFDYFDSEVDPHGDRRIQQWDYVEPLPPSGHAFIAP